MFNSYLLFLFSALCGFFTSYYGLHLKSYALALSTIGFIPVYFLGFFILLFLIVGLLVFNVDKTKQHPYNNFYRKLFIMFIYGGIIIFNLLRKQEGKKLVKKLDSNYILICNHYSNFDSGIIDTYLKKEKLMYIGKDSLLKIPYIGKITSKIGYLFIDRNNLRDELHKFNEAIDILNEGKVSIGIFPEGTRNDHESNRIQEFHPGSFRLALYTNKPIVLSVIKYKKKLSPNFLKLRKLHYKIFKVIQPSEYEGMTSKELCTLVKSYMDKEFATFNV